MADNPSRDRVQDNAERRQSERAETAENILTRADEMLGEHKYPVSSEELAIEYGDEPIDLPNETESLGSVFDRMSNERFESAEDAREAIHRELTGSPGTDEEYNEERDLGQIEDADEDDVTDSGASDM